MLAQLIPLDGGEPIEIKRDLTLVGRSKQECDLCINRKSISKLHCIIVRTDGLLFVRDLQSTNGTKVNGQKIMRGALLPGDQLSFGSTKFRVHLGPDPEPEHSDMTQAITGVADILDHAAFAIEDEGSASDVRFLFDDEAEE